MESKQYTTHCHTPYIFNKSKTNHFHKIMQHIQKQNAQQKKDTCLHNLHFYILITELNMCYCNNMSHSFFAVASPTQKLSLRETNQS